MAFFSVSANNFDLCFFITLLFPAEESMHCPENQYWAGCHLSPPIPQAWTTCVAAPQRHLSHVSVTLLPFSIFFSTIANLPHVVIILFSRLSQIGRHFKTYQHSPCLQQDFLRFFSFLNMDIFLNKRMKRKSQTICDNKHRLKEERAG